jgi:hypothetical protein
MHLVSLLGVVGNCVRLQNRKVRGLKSRQGVRFRFIHITRLAKCYDNLVE